VEESDQVAENLEQLAWLAAPAGDALLGTLSGTHSATSSASRIWTKLRAQYPAELVAAALTLTDLRHQAADKFTHAAEMFFTRPGLEQATSEPIARHRAARYRAATRIADLCCGIGGDLIALAEQAPTLAVDRDPLHLRMAALNAIVYGLGDRVDTVEADVRDVDLTGIDAVFVDPARRTPDRRLGRDRSEPTLARCLALTQRVPAVGIKAAPGLDLALVPPAWEVEFVAVGRNLKEAALYSPALATAPRRATVLPSGDSLVPILGDPVPLGSPAGYLLDPNPAVTRAGLVEDLARQLDAWKLDDQIAFLATDRLVQTPFARTLRVVDSLPWHQKRLAARLRELEIGAVDIRRRGLPGDVEAIRRALKLRGSRRATLAMTRLQGRPWCLICVDDLSAGAPRENG
jgi:hypothetical protein